MAHNASNHGNSQSESEREGKGKRRPGWTDVKFVDGVLVLQGSNKRSILSHSPAVLATRQLIGPGLFALSYARVHFIGIWAIHLSFSISSKTLFFFVFIGATSKQTNERIYDGLWAGSVLTFVNER